MTPDLRLSTYDLRSISCDLQPATSDRPSATCDGFTLVEMLIACALVSLVAGAVVATLAGGLRVWERVQAFGTRDQAIEIAFHQMRSDLRSAHRFEPIPFTGRSDTMSFPSVIEMYQGEQSWEEVGQTTYLLDRRHRQLRRVRQPYRMMRRARASEGGIAVLDHVERFQVRYYQLNAASGTYQWRGSCESAEPPLAVQVEIGCRAPGAQELTTRSLRVYIPTAPWAEDEEVGSNES